MANLRLEKITNSDDFWALYEELIDDNSGFLHNRATLLDAFKTGKLFGLSSNTLGIPYCTNSKDLLPCLCAREGNKAIIIWTHTRARKRGYARRLVELLDITCAFRPQGDSLDFWAKCGVTDFAP